MTVYDWPSLNFPQTVAFNKRGMSVSGPVSLTGGTQVGQLDAGYWIATLSAIPLRDATAVRMFRALSALLEGGAHHVRVPVHDCAQAPWPRDGAGRAIATSEQVPFSDDTLFSDDTGFAQPVIVASAAEDAALRATAMTIDYLVGDMLMGGEYFSIGDRLHIVRAVLSVDDTEVEIGFWPPLREAVAAGTQLNFDRPVCRMRLASESDGDLSLALGRRGQPDMAFVEVI